MDITLERILSLLPHKPDGTLKHGAKGELATLLGFKDGHIFADWIAGRSTSYTNYLYAISDKYNVSVEWLKGETDEKEKPAKHGELTDKQVHLLKLFENASPELRAAALAVLESAEK